MGGVLRLQSHNLQVSASGALPGLGPNKCAKFSQNPAFNMQNIEKKLKVKAFKRIGELKKTNFVFLQNCLKVWRNWGNLISKLSNFLSPNQKNKLRIFCEQSHIFTFYLGLVRSVGRRTQSQRAFLPPWENKDGKVTESDHIK